MLLHRLLSSQAFTRDNAGPDFTVQVKGSGVSKVFLTGRLHNVHVDISGISEVHLDPSSGAVRLSRY